MSDGNPDKYTLDQAGRVHARISDAGPTELDGGLL